MPITPSHWTTATSAALRSLLSDEGIEAVHLGLFDGAGVFREKRLPTHHIERYLRDGWSFIDALPYWGPNDETRADRAYRSEPCTIDPASARPYPFEPRSALLVADYSGDSAALSPRSLLATQIERARRMGYSALGAAEFEFIVLAETPASITEKAYDGLRTHAQENRCWSGLYPATGAAFLADYQRCLQAGDIPLHHLCTELGPGCLEAALPVRPLAAAADDSALFKLFTKAFCIERGLTASFMAQLSDQHPGLGGHPIVSLRTLEDDAATFHDAADPRGLSLVCRQFIAGVLTSMPELMPMFAATTNAYRRYVPGNWAPRTATWGVGNYTCALRVVSATPDECRIEFRLPGADMNPHLAFAMLLGAGLDGIEQGLEPPAETLDIGRALVHPTIGPLPRTLLEAAERMAVSARARKLFGERFVALHSEHCIEEDHRMRRHVSAFERERYLHHV